MDPSAANPQKKKKTKKLKDKNHAANNKISIEDTTNAQIMAMALRCPMCNNLMTCEILLCETGHSICGSCNKNLCPTCGSKITLQRNFNLEGLAQSMQIQCDNSQFGCRFKSFPCNMKEHYTSCKYVAIPCPIGEVIGMCQWKGTKFDAMTHVRNMHPDNAKYKFFNEVHIDGHILDTLHANVQMVAFVNDLFLFHTFINLHQQIAYFALQYVGHESIAKKWKYKVTFKSSYEPLKKIEITSICTSNTVKVSSGFDKGYCIAIPLCLLRTYIHKSSNKLAFVIHPDLIEL